MMKSAIAGVLTAVFAALATMPSMGAMVVQSETIDGIEWKYIVSDGAAEVTSGGNSPAIPYETSGEITVPDTLGGYPVTSIGANAFCGEAGSCYLLTGVTIPNSVTNIGYHAFFGCYDLLNVTIGSGVTSIGNEAFAYCGSVTNITFKGNAPDIGDYAFDPIGEDCVVHVSYSSTGWNLDADGTWNGIMVERYLDEASLPDGAEIIDGALNYKLTVIVPEHGSVLTNGEVSTLGWVPDGGVVTLTAIPDTNFHFVGWTGDTNGCQCVEGDESGPSGQVSLVVTMNQPRTIGAEFARNAISPGAAANAPELNWHTEGNAEWTGEWTETAADGEHAARSGQIGDKEESVLVLTLEGAGTLSFDWRVSCELNDSVQFLVDGIIKKDLSGTQDWTNVTWELEAGSHEVRWKYWKGRRNSAGEDAAWIDNVSWTPLTLADAIGNFVWETDGHVEWSAVRSADAYEGGSCAIAAGLADNQTAILRTTVRGSGLLTFRWAVSCENMYDWFYFKVDGEKNGWLTGEEEWTEMSIELGEGVHVLEWEYKKDEEDEPELVGDNCARLDYVQWFPQRKREWVIFLR